MEDVNVEAAAEFAADFFERADEAEAEGFVEVQAFTALLGDAGDEGVKSETPGLVDDGGLELAADALAAEAGFDVEGGFSGLVVGGAIGPLGERGPADDLAVNGGNEDGMAVVVRLEPGLAFGEGFGLGVERGGGGEDGLVVDRGDGFEIGESGGADVNGISHSR